MKSIVLGDRHTVVLFSMTGFEGSIIENKAQAVAEVKRVRNSKEYGLLIINEKTAQWASDLIDKIRFSKSRLVVVEIPDKDGHIETGKTLADYIREAVGIRI